MDKVRCKICGRDVPASSIRTRKNLNPRIKLFETTSYFTCGSCGSLDTSEVSGVVDKEGKSVTVVLIGASGKVFDYRDLKEIDDFGSYENALTNARKLGYQIYE